MFIISSTVCNCIISFWFLAARRLIHSAAWTDDCGYYLAESRRHWLINVSTVCTTFGTTCIIVHMTLPDWIRIPGLHLRILRCRQLRNRHIPPSYQCLWCFWKSWTCINPCHTSCIKSDLKETWESASPFLPTSPKISANAPTGFFHGCWCSWASLFRYCLLPRSPLKRSWSTVGRLPEKDLVVWQIGQFIMECLVRIVASFDLKYVW